MVDQTTETAASGLDITDIQNAVQIIDHACEQGAFKGWDAINKVLAVRQKLTGFVATVVEAQKAAQAAATAKAADEAAVALTNNQ